MADSTDKPGPASANANAEWFDHPDPESGASGLRFSCTQCGNCCSGPPGYVIVDDAEIAALAAEVGLSDASFRETYCQSTFMGFSLKEKESPAGFDCVFLDRERVPGRAVCSVYGARPAQCRAWPFWPALLRSPEGWSQGKRTCPGMGKGERHTPQEIRMVRATIEGRLDPAR